MSRALVALVPLVALSAGCTGKGDAKVGDAWIPQADGVIEAKPGATLEVNPDTEIEAIPDDPVVRLGIDRNVPFEKVARLVEWVRTEGKEPVLLVGRRSKIKAIVLSDELEGEPITATATTNGKLCVQPPGSIEAGCVQRKDEKHISRAYTRELVREATKAYRLFDVELIIPPDLGWGDVVRAVDGARTCCEKGTTMRVRIKGFPAST